MVTPFEISHYTTLLSKGVHVLSVSNLKLLKEFHNIIYMYFISFYKLGDCRVQKSNLISKIKCTMPLEQLYCMYYNTKLKSALKGVIVMCFHPIDVLNAFHKFHVFIRLQQK
jgi:hypothetical protein